MLSLRTPTDAALSRLEDEALVLLVQQHGHQHPATQVVLLRHLACVCRRAAWLARRRQVHRNDVLDAQQEAVLAMIDAIHAYVPRRSGIGPSCTFRSFLWRVIGARIANFLRHLSRAAARQKRGAAHQQSVRQGGYSAGDPLVTLQRRELREYVARAVGALDPEAQLLCAQVSRGDSLRALAGEVGSCYQRLKRRWHALREQLAAQLQDWAD
jgi:DNA-directed RNA polymerase specialized sigma24 family protein